MKSIAAVICLVLIEATACVSRADTFGSGTNLFTIDFTEIANPGNAADLSGDPNPAGAVGYTYRIGTYEVSEDMVSKANALGILGITADNRAPNKPATSVNWNEAARFVNWLNTSSGYGVAYKFSKQPGDVGYDVNTNLELWQAGDVGYDTANPYRNSGARYVLPTTDEWYKSAYYDSSLNGGAGGYWNYATASDSPPAITFSGTAAGTAVYGQWPSPVSPAEITLAGGLSPYGTMGQTGNVYEWNESPIDLSTYTPASLRSLRGGNWSLDSVYAAAMSSSTRQSIEPTFVSAGFGFRVAVVPEPSAYVISAIATAALAGLMRWRKRRTTESEV
jgi:formylglycine-generating enzyme